jgi:hypothetical protein
LQALQDEVDRQQDFPSRRQELRNVLDEQHAQVDHVVENPHDLP